MEGGEKNEKSEQLFTLLYLRFTESKLRSPKATQSLQLRLMERSDNRCRTKVIGYLQILLRCEGEKPCIAKLSPLYRKRVWGIGNTHFTKRIAEPEGPAISFSKSSRRFRFRNQEGVRYRRSPSQLRLRECQIPVLNSFS